MSSLDLSNIRSEAEYVSSVGVEEAPFTAQDLIDVIPALVDDCVSSALRADLLIAEIKAMCAERSIFHQTTLDGYGTYESPITKDRLLALVAKYEGAQP
jgi:hypothetical protein